jgi:hypothetical protein
VLDACLLCAASQLGLDVREEGDDRDGAQLLVGLEPRGEREGVEPRVVQVEDEE